MSAAVWRLLQSMYMYTVVLLAVGCIQSIWFDLDPNQGEHRSFGVSATTPDSRMYDLFLQSPLPLDRKYAKFADSEKIRMREKTREMFSHAYRGYMKYAFPHDELNPIKCVGRGPDYQNP
jgi:hypothetical protein